MSLLKFILFLCCFFAFAYFANSFVFDLLKEDTGYTAFSLFGILSISFGSIIAFILPRPKRDQNYSEIEQLLHRLALDNKNIHLRLFRRGLKRKKKSQEKGMDLFVVVSGLARAGTTSFMNHLMDTEAFSSLSYNDMPFILSPGALNFIKRRNTEKERSHKDGIQIGVNSNEALEEYFWKASLQDAFIENEALELHDVTTDIYNDYLSYQRLVIKDHNSIYLAKNNNFILRYKAIRERNKEFVFVLLVREPLSHAGSLLAMHKNYAELQETDPFVLEYMNWLGHHEFGINQKSMNLGAERKYKEKTSINFWIEEWINYYAFVLANIEEAELVFYEDYCKDPSVSIKNVMNKAGKEPKDLNLKAYSKKRAVEQDFESELLNNAREIYTQLQAKFRS